MAKLLGLVLGGVLLAAVVTLVGVAVLITATVVVVFTVARWMVRAHRKKVTARADRYALMAHQHAELLARAELQHRWFMAGDPRGTYGRYTPAA
jgi:hypothetical protein